MRIYSNADICDSLLIVVHGVDVYIIDILPMRIYSNADICDCLLIVVHGVDVYMHQNTAQVRLCYKFVSFGYVIREYLLQ